MQPKSKVLSYLGFALKSRKIKRGVNTICTLKGKVKVLIICQTASENTFKDAISLSKKLCAQLIVSKTYKVEDLVHKEKCKLIAVEDDSLATAILQNLDDDFIKYSEDNIDE